MTARKTHLLNVDTTIACGATPRSTADTLLSTVIASDVTCLKCAGVLAERADTNNAVNAEVTGDSRSIYASANSIAARNGLTLESVMAGVQNGFLK